MSEPISILGALSPASQQQLMQHCRARHFPAGSALFYKGDDGSWLYLIESGLVEISLMSVQGKKATLNHLGPGELIGELSALDQLPRSADALALADTDGLVIPKQRLAEVLRNDSDACLEVIRLLCSRVRNASDMFEHRAVAPAAVRLAHCLLTLIDKWGEADDQGSQRLSQQLSQTELGEFAGLARENVNRLLKEWQLLGWLRFHRGELTVLDTEALQAVLDQHE
ncbi:MAG TPA: Crp/Fnr family transcriptional regulator [Marinobacter sp.]|nr:Crp/Fnr family transcriptional regulator [Marinobacter sp.]